MFTLENSAVSRSVMEKVSIQFSVKAVNELMAFLRPESMTLIVLASVAWMLNQFNECI